VTDLVNKAWTKKPSTPTTFNTFCDKMEAAAGDAAKITAAKTTLWGSIKGSTTLDKAMKLKYDFDYRLTDLEQDCPFGNYSGEVGTMISEQSNTLLETFRTTKEDFNTS